MVLFKCWLSFYQLSNTFFVNCHSYPCIRVICSASLKQVIQEQGLLCAVYAGQDHPSCFTFSLGHIPGCSLCLWGPVTLGAKRLGIWILTMEIFIFRCLRNNLWRLQKKRYILTSVPGLTTQNIFIIWIRCLLNSK